jgi:hypothetical protein
MIQIPFSDVDTIFKKDGEGGSIERKVLSAGTPIAMILSK